MTEDDIYLFNEGTHYTLYEKMGGHLTDQGAHFAVWAPNARTISIVGDFNRWDRHRHPLTCRGQCGIWEGFIPGLKRGTLYKYHIVGSAGREVAKSDPYGIFFEQAVHGASVLWDLDYTWSDLAWMNGRAHRNSVDAPISIYEVHLGSWRRAPEDPKRFLTYRELAAQLPEYLTSMGFTHVEFMPVMEHPFYASWGYQVNGYYAPTSRYGSPQDFMYLVDKLHQAGIGVFLDWVPSHFATDEHGLGLFDGTHLYEHDSPSQGRHPEWDSWIFNYGRHEVRSFLVSNALFWLERYHVDGLRVDAVASMLHLDYARDPGQWVPNRYGGRENLEAIDFLRQLNCEAYRRHPDILTMAEDSTAWPMVTRPVHVGGLGFGAKWDLGWMHDTLKYLSVDPLYRRYQQQLVTFRQMYAYAENYILPLSHDEVVHLKRSLLEKMPGDDWQKAATLRLLFGYMFTTPGKKLLFMGGEFGQRHEWNHEVSLDWHVLQNPLHAGIQKWMMDLNRVYQEEPGLYELDCEAEGFQWVDCNDVENSILSYLRKGNSPTETLLVICNFTPVVRYEYRVGVPVEGRWREILNSDAPLYGGSGVGNLGEVKTFALESHGFPHSLAVTLPPLAAVVFASPAANPAAEQP